MADEIRQRVRERAAYRCEYCHIREDQDTARRFQLEHVRPKQHGGTSDESNLAWSCPYCNCHKGTNMTGIDPDSDRLARLFNPRTDDWNDHFTITDHYVFGRTSVGRATVQVLAMNEAERIELRMLTS